MNNQKTFQVPRRVRFADVDHADIVYFPRYLNYCHEAFEDFFDNIEDFSYRKLLDEEKLGWPAVHVDSNYFSPLRFGDDFVIEVSVVSIGTKSACFRYRMLQETPARETTARETMVCAETKITVACLDMRTFKAVAIPQKYRDIFETYATAPDK